jgi:hypothetical protein
MRILSLDLSKFKTVACDYEAETGRHQFATVLTTPKGVHDLIVDREPDRVVIEITAMKIKTGTDIILFMIAPIKLVTVRLELMIHLVGRDNNRLPFELKRVGLKTASANGLATRFSLDNTRFESVALTPAWGPSEHRQREVRTLLRLRAIYSGFSVRN